LINSPQFIFARAADRLNSHSIDDRSEVGGDCVDRQISLFYPHCRPGCKASAEQSPREFEIANHAA